jgi:phosphoglycerate dehydrogenase-like enzyme
MGSPKLFWCRKEIGIVGCGRIGQVVASSATAMGMQIIGYHPIISAQRRKEGREES